MFILHCPTHLGHSVVHSQTVIATTTQAQVTVPTTDAGQVGPIGQPQSTLPGQSETPFTYTTTNAEGLTVAVVATFTPSFPATVPRTGLATGTILSYSQWLSMVGTNTVAADSSSAGAKRWSVSGKWVGIIAGLVVGAAGGAGLVLA